MRAPSIGSVLGVRVLAFVALFIFISQLLGALVIWRQMQSREGMEYRLPLPGRVASIVEIVEATALENRGLLLESLNSATLSVRIEPALSESERSDGRRMPAFRAAVDRYTDALKGRQVIGMVDRYRRNALPDLREKDDEIEANFPMRLMIELEGDDWLVIETSNLFAERIRRIPIGFFAAMFGSIVAGLAVWAIWQEVRPVRDMAKAAHRFAGTGRPTPVTPAGGRDVRELIESFNAMQERIASLLANRTLVMSAMTHDVRTYLTRLRLRIEALEPDSRAAAEQTLADIQALLDDTLAFAEAGSLPGTAEPVDLAGLLEAILSSDQFPDGKMRLGPQAGPAVSGHAGRLQRALVNLISNAVKYGGEADITLSQEAGEARIDIADRGPGIPPEDRARVFEPFFRRDASRNRNVEGAGLGLAIAYNIVRGHGGTIDLADRPGGGLVVTVRLPVAG